MGISNATRHEPGYGQLQDFRDHQLGLFGEWYNHQISFIVTKVANCKVQYNIRILTIKAEKDSLNNGPHSSGVQSDNVM